MQACLKHIPRPRTYRSLRRLTTNGDDPKTIVRIMYEYGRFALFKLFGTEGHINFGYWPAKIPTKISLSDRQKASEGLYRVVADKLKLTSTSTLLDIGCGRGAGAIQIGKEYHVHRATGIDFSAEQIYRANEALNEEADEIKSRVNFVEADATETEFPCESFSHVLSVETVQHLPNSRAFISEAYRLLKPGGRLAVGTFFAIHPNATEALTKRIHTINMGIDHAIFASEFKAKMRNQGFKDITQTSIGDRVFDGFDAWMQQINPDGKWSQDWRDAYYDGLLDYLILTGDKYSFSIEPA